MEGNQILKDASSSTCYATSEKVLELIEARPCGVDTLARIMPCATDSDTDRGRRQSDAPGRLRRGGEEREMQIEISVHPSHSSHASRPSGVQVQVIGYSTVRREHTKHDVRRVSLSALLSESNTNE